MTPVAQRTALIDEVAFWSRQLSEHALFLHLGLEDVPIKRDALLLHKKWEAFRSGQLKADVLTLAAELRAFKVAVFDRMQRGQWLGWLFPSFVDHTRRELDLFVGHIRSGALDGDELCHWLRFLAEHAAFAAHLLDPVEADKIRAATAAVAQFQELRTSCNALTPTLLSLSQRAGVGLDAWLKQSGLGTAATKSVVHPVLAAHVVREGQRFLQTVDAIQRGVGA